MRNRLDPLFWFQTKADDRPVLVRRASAKKGRKDFAALLVAEIRQSLRDCACKKSLSFVIQSELRRQELIRNGERRVRRDDLFALEV